MGRAQGWFHAEVLSWLRPAHAGTNTLSSVAEKFLIEEGQAGASTAFPNPFHICQATPMNLLSNEGIVSSLRIKVRDTRLYHSPQPFRTTNQTFVYLARDPCLVNLDSAFTMS